MLLYFIRFIFVIVIIALLLAGIQYNLTAQDPSPGAERYYTLGLEMESKGDVQGAMDNYKNALQAIFNKDLKGQEVIWIFSIGVLVAILVIIIDWLVSKKNLTALAGIFFGLLVGVLISWAMSPIIDMFNDLYLSQFPISEGTLKSSKWILAVCICYLTISLVIKTKDDVRFVIPYIEFARQTKGLRPLVLDTSVIIDGRIADIAQTKLFDAPLIVPRFVLNELQLIADSPDKIKRNRGRRGLDILNKLQNNPLTEIQIDDTPPPSLDAKADVDHKLIAFSKNCDGRLVTNDYNLNKVAQLRGVDVININDLAKAMKTTTLPGETMDVKIIRAGEEPQQGIGYLEDGTMVVVENARSKIGENILIAITSSLQTSAGRMVFGKYEKTLNSTTNFTHTRRENKRPDPKT